MAFVAVGELDVGVFDGFVGFRELFQADDGYIDWRLGPAVMCNELAPDPAKAFSTTVSRN